jgi:hypothetical protein
MATITVGNMSYTEGIFSPQLSKEIQSKILGGHYSDVDISTLLLVGVLSEGGLLGWSTRLEAQKIATYLVDEGIACPEDLCQQVDLRSSNIQRMPAYLRWINELVSGHYLFIIPRADNVDNIPITTQFSPE